LSGNAIIGVLLLNDLVFIYINGFIKVLFAYFFSERKSRLPRLFIRLAAVECCDRGAGANVVV